MAFGLRNWNNEVSINQDEEQTGCGRSGLWFNTGHLTVMWNMQLDSKLERCKQETEI